jgi:long-chain acyl-CoA synthetase
LDYDEHPDNDDHSIGRQPVLQPAVNVASAVLDRAVQIPDRVALWYEDGTSYSFRELDGRSTRLAGKLRAQGLGLGDRLCVYMMNSPELVIVLLACLRSGVVYVPAHLMLQAGELRHVVTDAHCKALLAEATGKERVAAAGLAGLAWIGTLSPDVPAGWVDLNAVEAEPFDGAVDVGPEHEAFVIYTSGTTGLPKGAVQTHGGMTSWLNSQGERARGRPGPYEPMPDTTPPNINAMPLSHGTGLLTLFFAFHMGRPIVLMTRFQIDTYLGLVQRHKVDNLFGAPTMFQMLANHKDADRYDLSSVKAAMSGGAPLIPAVAQRFEERFGVPIMQTYGQTETGPIASWSPRDIRAGIRKPGSVGRVHEGVRVRIVDEAGDDLPAGETGEIVATSPSVMAGYLGHGAQDTKVTVKDGWVHTGDLGYLDSDGWLFITGRKRELIIVGGFNVYPAELENVLLQHPSVEEVVVVAGPDERLVEVPVAYVVADPPVAEKELIEFCRDRVAHYKAVRHVFFVDELPKGETRKVLLGELQTDSKERLRAGAGSKESQH